jgi:hypothetical protein
MGDRGEYRDREVGGEIRERRADESDVNGNAMEHRQPCLRLKNKRRCCNSFTWFILNVERRKNM